MPPSIDVASWGRYRPTHPAKVHSFHWIPDKLPASRPLLPYGQGRSYGDVCLNDNGTILDTRLLNRFIQFDPAAGTIRCEPGVRLFDILSLSLPHGWFLPVTPGTKFVSIGGAIANDVHGKNHHRAGTFGCHVQEVGLLRSDSSHLTCSPTENADLFRATIGGLGLTGLITWAELQLKPITSPELDAETIKADSLDHFLRLFDESDADYEYTVGWVDLSTTRIRGHFMRANHVPTPSKTLNQSARPPRINLNVTAPNWLISTPIIKAFNWLYYHRQPQQHRRYRTHYDPFFYPLDVIGQWNRLYGTRGLQSFHCVLPRPVAPAVVPELLARIRRAGLASPLTVIKTFGNKPSPGLLSFPRPGVNLLLDFHNRPNVTQLLEELDNVVAEAGGRINPSKDAHMLPHHFRAFYPAVDEFRQHIDPAFSSDFWRRVAG